MVGVEGIQTAIDEFQAEHPDIPLEKLDRTSEGGFNIYAAPGLSILRGDFFELTSASEGTFDLVRLLLNKVVRVPPFLFRPRFDLNNAALASMNDKDMIRNGLIPR